MSGYVGILVSDPCLQNQFTQVELRSLKSHFTSMRRESGKLTLGVLASRMSRLKAVGENLSDQETTDFIAALYPNFNDEVDFESFLKVYLKLHAHASSRTGNPAKNSSAFLKAATTTLLHTISESEKASYVAHINNYLAQDGFLNKYLPIDPSSNDLFEIVKDGVLLCKLINVAVPGTIDERAINNKRLLNPWERNENHTLCLNSAKAIGCTVVNIGTQDFIEGRIQLLADLNLKKTPQLVELVDDSKEKYYLEEIEISNLLNAIRDNRGLSLNMPTDVEELMSLPPEKILLRWMNFQLKKSSYKKIVTNFSTDVKDAEAYAHLLNVLAPEHSNPSTLAVKDPLQRAKLVLDHADRMGCKRYLTAKDIVDGSPNLNLAFVAHIFQHRWILLETLDKVSPGIVNWKVANKPPIKLPFKKVENCNQVVKIGKQLKFSLVNIAGNDIVQGNKKLILGMLSAMRISIVVLKAVQILIAVFLNLYWNQFSPLLIECWFFCSAYLWQLMRFNILQLLKNLRSHSHGKEITDVDILRWANTKVSNSGSQSRMDSFKDKSLSDGIFFLELLSAVQPRSVNWNLVTKGVTDEQKKMNATYIISIARKLGCSIFLLPEDIIE
ncbi:hypothetical protein Goari_005614, partial [Gossypium aridum]|nr:hypothetical protein [Gossypium aridum]